MKTARRAEKMRYADLHCDFLSFLADLPPNLRPAAKTSAFDAWKNGGCALQCFAVFCKGESAADEQSIQTQLALFKQIKPEFETATGGKAILAVEGGGATRGEQTRLKALFDAGVKIFSPVWNNKNSLSNPCGAAGGLTKKGKAAVEYALERGVIPDISHASDDAAREIFAIAKAQKKRVCATHSMVRALSPHIRNLTDAQIRSIAESGGVIGVNFVREFAGKAEIARHIGYIVEKGGENVVAIGSDFYGTENPYPENPERLPDFFRTLEKRFTPRQIEKLAYSNAARLFFS